MTFAAADTLLASSAVDAARNVAILLGVVFWLATVYWVYKDARRRIEDLEARRVSAAAKVI